MANPMSYSELMAKARTMQPNPKVKTRDSIYVEALPSPDEEGVWGCNVIVRRYSGTQELALQQKVTEGLTLIEAARNMPANSPESASVAQQLADLRLPEMEGDSDEYYQWLFNVYSLMYGTEFPTFSYDEAVDLMNDQDGSPVAKPILFAIKQLNDSTPGMEDIEGALNDLKRMPQMFYKCQAALIAGDIGALLKGEDEALNQTYERWGLAITGLAMETVKKYAVIFGNEIATAIVDAVLEVIYNAVKMGESEQDGLEPQGDDEPGQFLGEAAPRVGAEVFIQGLKANRPTE